VGCMGLRAVTGFSGTQCVDMLVDHEKWSHTLKFHPQYDLLVVVFNCLRTLSKIARQRFDKDSELIDEFETTAATLREVVANNFSNRKNQGNVDSKGYVLSETLKRLYPMVNFKNGFYEHQIFTHLVKFMREHGDLIKYSSWVIEAANRIWKRIVLGHICLGGPVGHGDSYNPSKQCLDHFLLEVTPEIWVESVRELVQRATGICSACLEPRVEGHYLVCEGAPTTQTEAAQAQQHESAGD
jgi:hypothetical protein